MSSPRNSFMDALVMNGGDGEHSYATNSRHQRNVISKTRPMVEENIREMLAELNFPKCIKVVDLGCSIGQNTFTAMSEIVDTIIGSYEQTSQNPPEIDYCLSDLLKNDFNSTFKLVPSFNEKVKGKCFISAIPGSFYSRLFPNNSLHFLHSSFSIHWLSKVPEGLEDNKSVYIRSGCSLNVCKSYMNQFQNDFYSFLRSRSEEMLPSGRMVLTCIGKMDLDPLSTESTFLWCLLSDALADLVSEGVIKESEMDSFNLPFYSPNEGEAREIIQKEGSFEIMKIETHELLVSYQDDDEEDDADYGDQPHEKVGKKMAKIARSITEPMLVAHFGDTNINHLFDKFAYHGTKYDINFPGQTTVNITISLMKK